MLRRAPRASAHRASAPLRLFNCIMNEYSRCAPFNAPPCSATATVFINRVSAVRVRSPRVFSLFPFRLLALRSRVHLPRLEYSSRAPSARFASIAIKLFCVLYNFLAPNVEKRLFHNLRSKITRLRRAPVAHRLRYKTSPKV